MWRFRKCFLSLFNTKQFGETTGRLLSHWNGVVTFLWVASVCSYKCLENKKETATLIGLRVYFWKRTSFSPEVFRSPFKRERVIDDLQVLRCTVTYCLGGLSWVVSRNKKWKVVASSVPTCVVVINSCLLSKMQLTHDVEMLTWSNRPNICLDLSTGLLMTGPAIIWEHLAV